MKLGYRLVGDVDFLEVFNGVFGGVGLMIVVMLLRNILDGVKWVIG